VAEYDLGRARGRIEIDASGVDRTMRGVERSITGSTSRGRAALGVLAKGFTAIAAGGALAIGTGVKLASDMQQARIAFEQFLGSGEKAEEFLGRLQKFAATTPFEFPDLRDAASKFLSVGLEADRVIPIMTSVGDAVAAVGGGGEEIARVTRALQQMQLKGRVTNEELLQMTEAGVPAAKILAEHLGVTVTKAQEMVSKKQVEVNEIFAAMEQQAVPSLQRTAGMMEAQSKTLAGLFSTLKDEVSASLITIAQPLVEGLTKVLPGLTKTITRTMEDIGPVFADVFGNILKVIRSILPSVVPLAKAFGRLLAGALDALIPLFEALAPVVLDLFKELEPLIPILVGVVRVLVAGMIPALQAIAPILPEIVAGFAAFKVIRGVQSIFTSLLSTFPTLIAGLLGTATAEEAVGTAAKSMLGPWALIAAAVVFLATLIIKNWDTIKKFLLAAWEFIKSTAITVWNAIKDFFIGLWNAIASFFVSIWNGIKSAAIAVFNAIRAYFVGVFNFYKALIIGVWRTIKAVVLGIINALKNGIIIVFNVVKAVLTTIWNGIKTVASAVWNGIKTAVMTPINALKGFLKGAWNAIKDTAVTVWNALSDAISGIWAGIESGLKAGINVLIGALNGLIKGMNLMIRGANILNPFEDIPSIPEIPYLARGIKNFAGGLAIVGEQGPELVNLKAGADVTPLTSRVGSTGGPTGFSLRGVKIRGTLMTAFGPGDMEAIIVDEIEGEEMFRQSRARARRS
jgi:tape measure domain-containing protein